MALLRTLDMLEAGERLNEELYRSTTRQPEGRFVARPLDPWRAYRAILAAATPRDKRAVSAR